jgi:hypothetical protein
MHVYRAKYIDGDNIGLKTATYGQRHCWDIEINFLSRTATQKMSLVDAGVFKRHLRIISTLAPGTSPLFVTVRPELLD